ncbi:FeoA domain-containing protein [Ereboglobus luteus]|uniref:DNA-binding protein n=1 Tax=Ereboglobus luteus TaxID=1796921 RepID=A0A2U8E573_9BACT|nr:FeoA domain-containing protein [Ereboglobus luteus]AWI10001.1 DNA-binding protein [Ereboglobus luteus]
MPPETGPSSQPVPSPSRHNAEQELIEDILRVMLECEYQNHAPSGEHLAGVSGIPLQDVLRALGKAREAGLVTVSESGNWTLAPQGREIGLLIMRAHRLTETRLARQSGVKPERWHEIAHEEEHQLSRDEVNRLSDQLDNPRFDPHGDPIPTREGTWPAHKGQSLLAFRPGDCGVIEHVEDEPPALFSRLVEAGVYAGMRFSLLEANAAACRLSVEAREISLPSELATMIRARPPVAADERVPEGARRLSDLTIGKSADVLLLLPGCIGVERSRLLDLGFVPGSRIEYAMQSPFHGPAAFSVRGTLIALRREQAEQVLICPLPETAPAAQN